MQRLKSFGELGPWHPVPLLPARPTATVETDVCSTPGAPVGLGEERRDKPGCTPCSVWGAAQSGGDRGPYATSIVLFASSRGNTGEPAREVKEGGEEAGSEPNADSKALQAVRWGRGVRMEESDIHGAGPEGEGRANGTQVVNERAS